jgi:hypothetical protein
MELLQEGEIRLSCDSANGRIVTEVFYPGRRRWLPEAGISGLFFCGTADNWPSSGQEKTNPEPRRFLNFIQYHTDDNKTEKLIELDPGHRFDTLTDFYGFLAARGAGKPEACDTVTFHHVPLMSGHDYRMLHDHAYKHQMDSIAKQWADYHIKRKFDDSVRKAKHCELVRLVDSLDNISPANGRITDQQIFFPEAVVLDSGDYPKKPVRTAFISGCSAIKKEGKHE